MYKDIVGRKIKEPIDYLIEASKKSKSVCIALKLGGYGDLIKDANALQAKIITILDNLPIEDWETAKHPLYRDVVMREISQEGE